MKYMGSKRAMLANGLGDLIRSEARSANRIVDLFAGSAAVSWYAAQNTNCAVISADLQHYSVTLALSVIGRTRALSADTIVSEWIDSSRKVVSKRRPVLESSWRSSDPISARSVQAARDWSAESEIALVSAYGGYYFSPYQAAAMQALMDRLPQLQKGRRVAHAALLMTAARCAAAPGHTAQPFGATLTALPYIETAWRKDPFAEAEGFVRSLAPVFARKRGAASVGDAADIAKRLEMGDLVFLDPPYSSVQYSRFYHVLEAISRQTVPTVSGTGRYPHIDERPKSSWSLKTQSEAAARTLFRSLARRGCRAILTFPDGDCSNGLTGTSITDLARESFNEITTRLVETRFSTLGGNGSARPARHNSRELILLLENR